MRHLLDDTLMERILFDDVDDRSLPWHDERIQRFIVDGVYEERAREWCTACNCSATKQCGHCHLAVYCNSACQRDNWSRHCLVCKQLTLFRELFEKSAARLHADGYFAALLANPPERVDVTSWMSVLAPGVREVVERMCSL